MANTGKTIISGDGYGILETYTNVEVDNVTKGDVPYSTIIEILRDRVGLGGGARFHAPDGKSSPLTMTLWIVLGSGGFCIFLILTTYFVSKKKKRKVDSFR